MEKLKNFEELVKDYIGPEKSVVEYNITNLTAPGENYLSEIVKIDAVLKHNGSGAEENLNVVAKLVTDDPLMGKTTTLTENELTFYTKIVPAVKRFHEKHGLPYPSFYPDFIGGRLNLNGSDEPDTDAVVVLENLKVQGYTNLDRHVGYDLETIKIVLKDLATFHAAPLAMKLLEPELFETEIKSNCSKPPPQFAPPGDRPGPPGPSGDRPEPPGKMPHPPFLEILLNLFEEKQYLDVAVKLKKFKEQSDYEMKYHPEKMFNRPPVEPFATLTHNDMWINNTMQLIKDGKTIKNKLVDFQMCRLGTPIQDFIFLLFSSVELACLKEHLDDLLKHYYESFADVLRKCDCYGPQFSYEKFVDEIKLQGRHAIGQCIMMCCGVIFAKKGHKVDIKNMETMTKDDMPPLAVEKMTYLCKEATKRDWF